MPPFGFATARFRERSGGGLVVPLRQVIPHPRRILAAQQYN